MSNELRVDGIYKSPPIIDDDDGEIYWRYLRFRNDGTVTMVSCTGTETDVAQWLDKDKHLAKGLYSVNGEKIEFWVKTEDELLKTRFEGTVERNTLFVRMWNSNGDYDSQEGYTFQRVTIEPPNNSLNRSGISSNVIVNLGAARQYFPPG